MCGVSVYDTLTHLNIIHNVNVCKQIQVQIDLHHSSFCRNSHKVLQIAIPMKNTLEIS